MAEFWYSAKKRRINSCRVARSSKPRRCAAASSSSPRRTGVTSTRLDAAGTEVKISDETYLIMTEEDILGVIE